MNNQINLDVLDIEIPNLYINIQQSYIYMYWSRYCGLPRWNAITGHTTAFTIIAQFTAARTMIRVAPMIWHRCTVMMMMMMMRMMTGSMMMTGMAGIHLICCGQVKRIQFRICIPGFKLKSFI